MGLKILFPLALLAVPTISLSLFGCAARQHTAEAQQHVSEKAYESYVQKYPEMGEAVKQGRLSKDAAYSLRNIAPQQKIMSQFVALVDARAVEVHAMHISKAEKHRLMVEYIQQNQMRYVNAANAAGKAAEQSSSSK